MRNVEHANQSSSAVDSLEEQQLDQVTGGCARGGCCPPGACGGASSYQTGGGGGIDPLFMMFALQLMSSSNTK